jgi:hypothetical protein
MRRCPEFKLSETEVDKCSLSVDICENVLECPCCCYFVDRKNRMDIVDFLDSINDLPNEVTQLKIPILPTPSNKYYYHLNGIETIIYNIFKDFHKKMKADLEKGLAVLKVYYEKDPLFTMPIIQIEIIFLYRLHSKTIDELWKRLKAEVLYFTGSVGEINIISAHKDLHELERILSIPLLVGHPEFKKEGALLKHNFSEEQIKEMNYIHIIGLITLDMPEIINNNKLTLFKVQRESIQKEMEKKFRNDKDVIDAIDAIFGKPREDEEFDDLPF